MQLIWTVEATVICSFSELLFTACHNIKANLLHPCVHNRIVTPCGGRRCESFDQADAICSRICWERFVDLRSCRVCCGWVHSFHVGVKNKPNQSLADLKIEPYQSRQMSIMLFKSRVLLIYSVSYMNSKDLGLTQPNLKFGQLHSID